jgi:hypothetical protein
VSGVISTLILGNYGHHHPLLNLKSNAAAEHWFNNLPIEDRDTWDHLIWVFNKKWLNKAPTIKTIEERQTALEQTRIREEEVGKRITTNGMEELAHVIWATERLATGLQKTSPINGHLVNRTSVQFSSVSVFFWFVGPDL